jgi:hypothetical protein
MSYVFPGEASFVKFAGAKPMNIEWKLKEVIPASLLKECRSWWVRWKKLHSFHSIQYNIKNLYICFMQITFSGKEIL